MAPLATVEDLALLQPLGEVEEKFAATMLKRASVNLRIQVLGLDSRIAADELLAEKAKNVVCAAVERVLNNPRNASSASTSDGPFSGSVSFNKTGNKDDLLYFTEEELSGLAPVTTSKVPFTARIGWA